MNENEVLAERETQINDFKNRLDPSYPTESVEKEIEYLFNSYLKLDALRKPPHQGEARMEALQRITFIESLKVFIANSLNAIAKHHHVDLFEEEEVD